MFPIDWVQVGTGAGATGILDIGFRAFVNSSWVQAFRDKQILVMEKLNALRRADLSDATVRETVHLIKALKDRIESCEAATEVLRSDFERISARFRLSLRYIMVLDKHNDDLRKFMRERDPAAILPKGPDMPADLNAALAEFDHSPTP